MKSGKLLTVDDHARDSAALRYVYPVISRRAGGVSVGINLNPNNACNWRCIYCQVPDLKRGGPPALDLELLRRELAGFLEWSLHGDFMATRVPEDARRLVDLAFSGNGEPTSAGEFAEAVALAGDCLRAVGLDGRLPVRLITNGSLLERTAAQRGIRTIASLGGEVWFKLDAATAAGIARINGSRVKPEAAARRLAKCAELAPTWVQTCVFALDGKPPAEAELDAYLQLLRPLAASLAGVHLYGLARPSQQPEAPRLSRLDAKWMEALAGRIRQLGLHVQVSP